MNHNDILKKKAIDSDNGEWSETLGEAVARFKTPTRRESHNDAMTRKPKEPSEMDLHKAKTEHPDYIFTNEDYNKILIDALVKEGKTHNIDLVNFPEEPENKSIPEAWKSWGEKIDEWCKLRASIVEPIYNKRYLGYGILKIGELPALDISIVNHPDIRSARF